MVVTPAIRTSPQGPRRAIHDGNSTLRLITKLLRELVTTQRFADYADLKDALRHRLSKLRIRYQQSEFDDAYPLVASNVPLVSERARVRAPITPDAENQGLSRADAIEAMVIVRRRLGPVTIRTIPRAPRLITRGQADKHKAARMIMAEVL